MTFDKATGQEEFWQDTAVAPRRRVKGLAMSKKVLKTFETLNGKHELSLVCGVYPPKPVDQCEQDEIWYCINGVSVTPQEFAQFYNRESPFAVFGKLGYDRYRKAGR